MMRKQTFIHKIALCFLIALILVTGCSPKSTETSEPQTGDNLTAVSQATNPAADAIAITSSLVLDPAITEDADSLLVSGYLYEGLVSLDTSGSVQPGIAESWVISDDQLDYIFEIRPNARFSDGTPITADIIAENFNRWFDPASPLHGDGNYPSWMKRFLAFNGERDSENRAISQVDGVQKVDANTFIIHLNRPEPDLLTFLAEPAFSILNTNALSSGEYGKIATTVLSSGKYIISSWTESGMTLSPNPNYWNPVTGDVNFIWK